MRIEDFKEPPVEYRPVPFLSVNDDVEHERLLELAGAFLNKGWGGLFFHARVGLITPYMGNRWFNLVKSVVEAYRNSGGKFWIYDEQGWPSGQAGGQVTRLRPEFRNKLLLCKVAGRGLPPTGTLRTHSLARDGKKLQIAFVVRTMPPNWLPDLLNPDAVKAFLEATHELYKANIGSEFGRVVPGIFTDEPQYATHHSLVKEKALPWTERLPDHFEEEHGYSLLECLPSLFFDVGEYRKVRYAFFSTLARLFVESYTRQIYDWCAQNGLRYTGHYEWEDSFLGQIHCIGSAMQHYEFMQMPGIDHLGRGLHNPWVEKQVASVASQLGRKRVLSETYGVSGQSLSFHDRRWIGNWQYALGINFLNHHVALYSLRGERKRDYPPTFSPQQPWWKHNRVVADYFSRLSYLLSQGRRAVEVLFISSLGGAWCEYSPFDASKVEVIFEGFETLTRNLLEIQVDFEYGDEFILERHGSVEGGRMRVGESTYGVVILPPMTSLRRNTFDLLRNLTDNGGRVLCVGERPLLVDGEACAELEEYVSRLPVLENTADCLVSALQPNLPSGPIVERVSGASLERLCIHRRKIGRLDVHFLVNTHYSERMRLKIDFCTRRPISELLPETGETSPTARRCNIEIAAGEGRLFVVGLASSGEMKTIDDELSSMPIVAKWRLYRENPNQAVLDYARCRRPNGEWSKLLPTWKVQDSLKAKGEEEFEVRYEFDSTRERDVDLVVEDAQKLDIYVNGKRVAATHAWWLDHSFRRMPIGDHVRPGRNFVLIKGRLDADMSIEDAYLLGDFSATVDGRLTPLLSEETREAAEIDDLRRSGYPFYAGELILEASFEIPEREGEPWIEFDDLGGTVVEFNLNGEDLGKVFWREYRVNATEVLKSGTNQMRIRLTNSLRNLLGPRHWTKDEFTGVNPNSFRDAHGWTDRYIGVPLGVMGLRVVWRNPTK